MEAEYIRETDVIIFPVSWSVSGARLPPEEVGFFSEIDYAAADGKGIATFTGDWERAMRFSSEGHARAFILRVSPILPEIGGKPNIPLLTWGWCVVPIVKVIDARMGQTIRVIN